jgi:hypothetical protein
MFDGCPVGNCCHGHDHRRRRGAAAIDRLFQRVLEAWRGAEVEAPARADEGGLTDHFKRDMQGFWGIAHGEFSGSRGGLLQGHHHGAGAPAGVMFDHVLPNAGDVMIGYRYMYANQAGQMQNGTNPVGDKTLLNQSCDVKLKQCFSRGQKSLPVERSSSAQTLFNLVLID